MISSKKALELPSQKLVLFILLALVLVIVLLNNDLSFFAKSALYEKTVKTCEFEEGTFLGSSSNECSPKNCDVLNCSEDEQNRWSLLKSGFEETSCFEDKSSCDTTFEETMYSLVVDGEVIEDLGNQGANPAPYSLSEEEVITKLSSIDSSSQKSFEQLVRETAQDLELNIAAIQALVKKESGKELSSITPIDSSTNLPQLRFECHIYNGERNSQDLSVDYCADARSTFGDEKFSCTIESGSSFSRVSSQTGPEAFENAREDNSALAICSTSFSAFQIMGFNAQMLGYSGDSKYQDFYDDVSTTSGQVKLFFRYLYEKNLLGEFQKQNPNWEVVARLYNGAGFVENNYARDLASFYGDYRASNIG